MNWIITDEEVEKLYQKLNKDALRGGYYLNPDLDFTKSLIKGLLLNEKRYGYIACPCRLADGKKELDIDIICPCDYRDPDLNDYYACYCGLYVSKEIYEGLKALKPIPERRIPHEDRERIVNVKNDLTNSNLKYPVWRCKVCGYLCARDNPPDNCPICKVTKDRFERFL